MGKTYQEKKRDLEKQSVKRYTPEALAAWGKVNDLQGEWGLLAIENLQEEYRIKRGEGNPAFLSVESLDAVHEAIRAFRYASDYSINGNLEDRSEVGYDIQSAFRYLNPKVPNTPGLPDNFVKLCIDAVELKINADIVRQASMAVQSWLNTQLRLIKRTEKDQALNTSGGGLFSEIIRRDVTEYRDPRVFGLELEIENPNVNDLDKYESALSSFGDMRGKIGAVYDGSLRNGVELLFSPRPRSIWLEQKNQIKAALKELQVKGFTSWESGRCGLHIHINRSCLSPEAVRRLERLVQFTAAPWLKAISGREIGNPPANERSGGPYYYSKFGKVRKDDKYRALNHNHTDTLELRFFRGSLDYPRLMANIEVAALLIDYVRESKRVSELSFNNWLGKNITRYPFANYKYGKLPRLEVPRPIVRGRRTGEIIPAIPSFNTSGI